MRKTFSTYYTPSEEEFDKLWQECIFSFDANILLHIYEYSERTRDGLFAIFKKLGNRIWIPHQAALEFQKDRITTIFKQYSPYKDVRKTLDDLRGKTESARIRHHPLLDTAAIVNPILSAIESSVEVLKKAEGSHPKWHENDPLRETLGDLLEGKVGNPFHPTELEDIYKKGERRFKMKIPPGYADLKDKQPPDCYGDYVIWRQLIDHAKTQAGKPFVFVTDDAKEDWWQLHGKDRIIAPRQELREEFQQETNAQFYMYGGDTFLKRALETLKDDVRINMQAAVQMVAEAQVVRSEQQNRVTDSALAEAALRNRFPDAFLRGHMIYDYELVLPSNRRLGVFVKSINFFSDLGELPPPHIDYSERDSKRVLIVVTINEAAHQVAQRLESLSEQGIDCCIITKKAGQATDTHWIISSRDNLG